MKKENGRRRILLKISRLIVAAAIVLGLASLAAPAHGADVPVGVEAVSSAVASADVAQPCSDQPVGWARDLCRAQQSELREMCAALDGETNWPCVSTVREWCNEASMTDGWGGCVSEGRETYFKSIRVATACTNHTGETDETCRQEVLDSCEEPFSDAWVECALGARDAYLESIAPTPTPKPWELAPDRKPAPESALGDTGPEKAAVGIALGVSGILALGLIYAIGFHRRSWWNRVVQRITPRR